MKTYQRKDVLEIVNVPKGRFNEWISLGFIQASSEKAIGKRIFKEYTLEDIYVIAAFKYMIEEAEISREVAGKAIREWKDFLIAYPGQKESVIVNITAFDIENAGRQYFIGAFPLDSTGNPGPVAVSPGYPLAADGASFVGPAWKWRYTLTINLKDVLAGVNLRLR